MSALDKIIADYKLSFSELPMQDAYGLYKDVEEASDELVQLRTSNQRMSDVVSAAVRAGNWLKTEVDAHKQVASCDCYECTLIRAVDKYIAEEK